MLVSGALIFTGGATSYFEGQWFRRKMTMLLMALVFNVTWFRAVTNAREDQFNQWQNRVTAGVALLLWFGVGVAGRAIAFF